MPTKSRNMSGSPASGTLLWGISLHAGASALLLAAAGCASPLTNMPDRDLRRSVRESSEREIAESQDHPQLVALKRESRVEALNIKPELMEQLSEMAGPRSYIGKDLPLASDLYGQKQKVVRITLERSISSAVSRNLNVEFARLSPAISQQQLVAAEAAFDWVLFANGQYNSTNEPRTASSINGFASGVSQNDQDIADGTLGVRKPLIAGGQFTLQSEWQYTDNQTPNLTTFPNPANETNLVLQLDQPLLRNFGTDVNLAQVRLARNTELDSIQQLKGTLLSTVNDTETAYWNLAKSQADLHIVYRLLQRGEETLKALRDRLVLDTKPATYSDAAATVEIRRADVIRAQRVVRDASDRLKVLINDPDLPVGSEVLLLASDLPLDQAVEYSLVDSINAALANRPEVQRAIISMDNTSIRQTVADNQRLPKLDLRALTRFSGLGATMGNAYDQIGEAEFVDYQVALNFEQAIGNRAAEATFRQRRLERMQAVIAYRNTVQGVVAEVKSALRDLTTNYVLIEQTRAARIAAAENVRALQVEEQTIQGLTPEFLNLKLQRQAALASAEQQEAASYLDYNTAMSRLYTATGTALERNRIEFKVPNITPNSKTSDLFPDFPLEPPIDPEKRKQQ